MNLLLDFYFLKSKHESILNILGNIEYISEMDCSNYEFIIAIGDNEARGAAVCRLPSVEFATVIHSSAIISNSHICEGSCIMACAIIQ